MEKALFLVKPNAVHNEIDILRKLKTKGFRIMEKKTVRLSREQATDFYQDQMQDVEFEDVVDYMSSGPCLAMLVERLDGYEEIAALVGNENPSLAKIESPERFAVPAHRSLRGLYGVSRIVNGFHASQDLAQAQREIQFFFPNSTRPCVTIDTLAPLPSIESAKAFLEDCVYPTLLQGLTALSKEKPAAPVVAQGDAAVIQKTSSLSSVRADDEVAPSSDDWLPVRGLVLTWQPKVLLKPTGQLQLNEKELQEEFTRILNANNPHAPQNISRYSNKDNAFKTVANMEHISFHFEFDGYLVYSATEEGEVDQTTAQAAEEGTDAGTTTAQDAAVGELPAPGEAVEEQTTQKLPLRNQFNYSERAAQTERSTNTEPPPQRPFSYTVNQWTIYDDYMEDLQIKEKAAKEKAKGASTLKAHKDGDKDGTLPDAHQEDVYYKNQELRKVMIIAERMANQNSFDDISQDYKYWEDAADDLGDKKSGSCLPLWKFFFQKEKQKQVTALCWSPQFSDLFVIGYGSYDFSRQGPGMIACFTLKNPSYPEFVYQTESGVMSCQFHPQHPSMIAVGLYDGSVLVYNIQKKTDQPVFRSNNKGTSKHTDPVWQVSWQKDDLDDNLVFFSVSSDGRVIQWTLLKNELLHTDVIALKYDAAEPGTQEDEKLFSLAGGCCFDFHKKTGHLFVVGTEEGSIYKCSKEYSSEHLLSYAGHSMAVYTVRYNQFNDNYFLSASSDWTVKLWDHNDPKSIMTFDLNGSVGDVAWAPFSSTVFAAVTAEGKIFVYDLSVNKYAPMCEQQIVRKAKLTHISFNPFSPILLVGDENGTVISLKLSPNLRKKGGSPDEEADKLQSVVNAAKGVSSY
ncbi:cytoplasmic dynein with WD40 domain [Kappamyces sp. JEL0829]|nr:cytoplasmic dynein with WD40 domain [Kappamyces sp. JEL0829]